MFYAEIKAITVLLPVLLGVRFKAGQDGIRQERRFISERFIALVLFFTGSTRWEGIRGDRGGQPETRKPARGGLLVE
ncbi:hypothetical protein AO287_23495 [Pseudomonas savastanoi]|uniref:Uncharacterized protein n=1 Tax=Pseudomonas savastanoi TaxID=29438 RepID=A0AAW3M5C3_PSESS|nr:hypothetical protein AO287_23495 [Pseudomonas savastanoi]